MGVPDWARIGLRSKKLTAEFERPDAAVPIVPERLRQGTVVHGGIRVPPGGQSVMKPMGFMHQPIVDFVAHPVLNR